ncbi:MAG: response regulator [Acidobacteriaceae bacterium]|nr:response regulator [Acidobacteriaceae bacterium]
MGPETHDHFDRIVRRHDESAPYINKREHLDIEPELASSRDRSFLVQDWRVLHIEDDNADAYLLRRALDQASIPARVHRCLDSEEGLYFLREMRLSDPVWPDIVLLDLNTPRMNGWDFLSTISADPSLQGLRIVIVTSSHAPEDVERASKFGVQGFYTKPDDFNGLVQMLEHIFAMPERIRSGAGCDTGLIAAH